MRLQQNAVAVAVVVATALSCARAADAEPEGTGAVEIQQVPAPRRTWDLIDVGRFFVEPVGLGDRWERRLQAVLKKIKRIVDLERIEAEAVLDTPTLVPRAPSPSAPLLGGGAAVPGLPPRRTEAPAPVQFATVVIEPVSEATVDTRGERGLLLGSKMELPWQVP